MFKNKSFAALLLIGSLTLACSQTEQPVKTTKKWQPEMDQPSELASIMRAIHEEGVARR